MYFDVNLIKNFIVFRFFFKDKVKVFFVIMSLFDFYKKILNEKEVIESELFM